MIGINEIKFGDKGTYSDFGLLMTGRTIGEAPIKSKSLNIPWRDGRLNYTKAAGRTYYDNRELNFNFKLIDSDNFYAVYSSLAEYLHGEYMRVTIPEEPQYYYYGMCSLSPLEVSKRLGTITITVDAEPYKYSKASSTEDIRWDDVNFLTTYFRYIGALTITDSYSLVIRKGGRDVVPVFNVTSITSNTLTVRSSRNNTTYTLKTGKNRFPALKVCGSSNVTLTFTGSGVLTVDYKEQRL